MDKIEFPILFLQSGKDFKISETLKCKHPTIQEIFDLDEQHNGFFSEDKYRSYISVFLTDPYYHMVFLDDHGLDYEQCSPFQVFIMRFDDYMSKYLEVYRDTDAENMTEEETEEFNNYLDMNIYYSAFKFFFGINRFFHAKDQEDNDVLVDFNNYVFMNEDIYNYVYEFIRAINGIRDSDDKINPEDEWAKSILIEDEREKLKKRQKKHIDDDEDDDLNSIGNRLSSLTWLMDGGVTPFNRFDLHIYDLIDGTHRYDKDSDYKNIMTGVYTGHIDLKKLNMKKLHWSTT